MTHLSRYPKNIMENTLQTIQWQNYHDVYNKERHTVSGNLKIAQQVESPELGNRRSIIVYLPPSYAKSSNRYPVLYMHDGQNLFDQATSFSGEWYVDETMEKLSREEGLEAIVVGIPNVGEKRLEEYSPYVDLHHGGGRGDVYLDFMVNTLKPIIDRDFRTLPGRENCGIMGSSMGGLISLYGFFRHPEVFGFTGVMSPSLGFAGGAIFEYVESVPFHPGKIYLDAGTRELGGSWPQAVALRARSRHYYGRVRRMKRILAQKGYRPIRDMLHVEEKWAWHRELAWAGRLPGALRFFLKHTSPYRENLLDDEVHA